MNLAIYDMDRTITRAPTWTPFLIHAARRRAPWRLALLPVAIGGMLAYAGKLIDRGTLKQFTHRLMIGGSLSPAERMQLADAFADAVIATGIFTEARTRIRADHQAGYRLVLATASYRFYAEAIAERLGFDAVVATESHFAESGDLLPRIAGENCYGIAKLRMVESWMAQGGIARGDAHIRFYSDHVSDAPVLEWADEAFAVNAHGPLRRLARERGWPCLDWEH
ncbi:HAD family hydrolase [Stakelama saccharophila]|uniref:HAD-IB family hydrolase n=1 Tax=Stakelama saccharophila TaxID=3075605 RepID=A0ABZ0B8X3_9SPHN|nr:HAD-IB family hydrolase [Stakelama sp. W311]WNO53872.1 HAD-IB family hydrolase [Stakelama sp. W311]